MATSPIGGELLQFWPGPTPDACTVRHTVLSRAPLAAPGVRELFDGYTPLIQNVVRDEDAVVLETCGTGFAAGRTDVVLGRNEIACQAAHRHVLADLDLPPG
jgi:hypothetical protein